MKNDQLEGRLRSWAFRRAANDRDIDRVHVRASERLRAEPHLELEGAPGVPVSRLRFPVWATAAAAALIVSVLLWQGGPASHDTAETINGDARELARIAPEHAAARARLFDETGAVFADRLRWLATIGDDVQVGLSPESEEEASGSPPLIVRLVVVLKLEGRDDWQRVWTADVLTRSEEFVVIRPRDNGGGEVALWVDLREDGRYVVESDLALSGPVRLATSATRVLVAGEPQQVLCLRSAEGEYRVYQTVEPLGGGAAYRG